MPNEKLTLNFHKQCGLLDELSRAAHFYPKRVPHAWIKMLFFFRTCFYSFGTLVLTRYAKFSFVLHKFLWANFRNSCRTNRDLTFFFPSDFSHFIV